MKAGGSAMAKRILADVMSPDDYRSGTKFHKFSFKRKYVKNPMKDIYNVLVRYHNITRQNKADLKTRWDLLQDIAQRCVNYAGSKPPGKRSSTKVKTVSRLGRQTSIRLLLESHRARDLAKTLNAPTRYVNVGSGHGPRLRFERIIKPGTVGLRGDELVDLAEEYGIKLTGDDKIDYYAMKKLLKIVRTKEADKLRLVYFSEEQRAAYRIDFDDESNMLFTAEGKPFDTLSNDLGVPPKTAMYAASLEGVFFARNWEDTDKNRGAFHHSSFLAGQTALCAGTLKAQKGRLLEVTNMSGHYSPKLEHLVEASQAVLNTGYDPKDDGYALYADFGNVFPTVKSAHIRVPLKKFVEWSGKPPNPEDFEVKMPGGNDSIWAYVNPEKAKARGCLPPTV
jgi:hypothetical protein